MQLSKVSYDKVKNLSFKDINYQLAADKLKDFIAFLPNEQGLDEAIKNRKNYEINRDVLVQVLSDQYAHHLPSDRQTNHIHKLGDKNTFTIVTAHQPALLGGPAYYFYKICSAIHLAEKLCQTHPDCHFVPVFINGSEDHDFDEVKSLNLYGKQVEWKTVQKGSVGRFLPTGLDEVIEHVFSILGNNDYATEINTTFKNALENAKTYNDFVFSWLNYFFRESGLLILNMDDKKLKAGFAPILKKEITERKSATLVQATQEKLLEHGFKPQAFARDINLFYLNGDSRERIYIHDGIYHVNNTTLVFSEEEILSHIDAFPERFSPNVVLRPIYQESTLPNIAYIGGGGEIAYWLERKTQFEYFHVFFPVLIRRNSVMLITKAVSKTIQKLELSPEDFIGEEENIITKYLEKSGNEGFHLNAELFEINKIFDQIALKVKEIDPTLSPYVLGEGHKVSKTIDAIESKLKRSLKQKEETSVNQIRTIKAKLFPENNLQERKESLLAYLVTEGKTFLPQLIDVLDPMEKDFLFIHL